MEGVIEEGSDALEKNEEGASFDSGLIGAALRTERYEIAGYKTCIAMAKNLDQSEIVSLLTEYLNEEVLRRRKSPPQLSQYCDSPPESPNKKRNPRLTKSSIPRKEQGRRERRGAGPQRASAVKEKSPSLFGGIVEAVTGR
jgi:hypothetical protein